MIEVNDLGFVPQKIESKKNDLTDTQIESSIDDSSNLRSFFLKEKNGNTRNKKSSNSFCNSCDRNNVCSGQSQLYIAHHPIRNVIHVFPFQLETGV